MRIGLLAAALLAAPALAGPRDDYAALLREVVREDGVDYGALRRERALLDAYVAALAAADPGAAGPERAAFWINAFNAATLQGVLDPGIRTWTVGGRALRLDAIRQEALRAGPRAAFALHDATRSGPPLRVAPYEAGTLDDALRQAVRVFLADPTRNRFDLARQRAELSAFLRDADRDGRTLAGFLAEHAPTGELARSLQGSHWYFAFLDRDGRLDEAGAPPAGAGGDAAHPAWFVLYGLAVLALLGWGLRALRDLRSRDRLHSRA